MSFEMRNTAELILLAQSGAGFTLKASMRTTEDLIMIAQAASVGNARVSFEGLGMRPTADLVRIGQAGAGYITVNA